MCQRSISFPHDAFTLKVPLDSRKVRTDFIKLRKTDFFSAMSIIYHNIRTFKSCPSQPADTMIGW